MPELIYGKKDIKIFHTAFITREKVNDYGINEYISKNKEIISTVKESITKASNVQIVIISSGAASKFDYKNPDKLDYQNDPYGSLKWLEEKTLGNLCDSLILRIYALSGRFLRDPDVFAFGDFIRSAIKNEQIILNSERQVIRGYGFDGDISALAFKWLISNEDKKTGVISAVSNIISLEDLAEKISKIYGLKKVRKNINKNLESNIYANKSKSFVELLLKYKIKPTSLENQIKETFVSLKLKISQNNFNKEI